jgi:hypothetical protein
VDDILPKTEPDTTICYFFFRDGDQSSTSSHAICAILHQLCSAKKSLLRQIRDFHEKNGDSLKDVDLFRDLWDILLAIARDSDSGDIVIVLDAINECVDTATTSKADLIVKISEANGALSSTRRFRMVLKSRPSTKIEKLFRDHNVGGSVARVAGETGEARTRDYRRDRHGYPSQDTRILQAKIRYRNQG